MEILTANNYIFNLVKYEDKTFNYISNNIDKKIRNRNELENFLLPIIKDFFIMIDNLTINKNKTAILDVYIEYDGNGKFIDFNQYKINYKDDKKIYEVFRLSKGLKWSIKYNYIKIKVNIFINY